MGSFLSGILGGATGGAGISIIIQAIDRYSKEFKKVDKGLEKQQSSFKKLGRFVKEHKLLVTAAAGAIAAFGIAAVRASLESERAVQQFNLAVGDLADTLLIDLRRASDGMVSDFDLINNANKAMALGIAQNKLPELLEVATARSKVFGRTVSEAFNDLAIGIGRQSRMILDNLGIILDLDKTYKDYAVTIGKTVDQVRELYAKEALVNAIIKDSEGLIKAQMFLQETHTEKVQRLAAAMKNLLVVMGDVIIASWDYVSGAEAMKIALENEINAATGMPDTYDTVSKAVMKLSGFQRDLNEELKVSKDKVDELTASILNLGDVTLIGERGLTLDIAKQKKVITDLKLRQTTSPDPFLDTWIAREEAKLAELRLENEQYANEKAIVVAQNALQLEGLAENEERLAQFRALSVNEFIADQQRKFTELDTELNKQNDIETEIIEVAAAISTLGEIFGKEQIIKIQGLDDEIQKWKDVRKEINATISAYRTATFTMTGSRYVPQETFRSRLATSLQFFPQTEAVYKDKNAFPGVTTTLDPLGGINTSRLLNSTIVNISNVNGFNGRDIADKLQEELEKKVTT